MRTVTEKLPSARHADALLNDAPTLTLPFHERSKSRLKGLLSNGEEVAISLARGSVMRSGEVLLADDGNYIRVQAAHERVLRVTTKNPHDLLRAAYHLGNRHTPVELGENYLHLEDDAVLADMLKRLGVNISHESLPFEPEHGAYGGGHKHGHDESFAEDYQLAQAAYASHGTKYVPSHEHGHAHGIGHKHHHHGDDAGHEHDHHHG